MFVGKFNFSKVCSNVFSPAFRDPPPQQQQPPSSPPANPLPFAPSYAASKRRRHHHHHRYIEKQRAAKPRVVAGGGGGASSQRLNRDNQLLDRQTSAFADRHGRKTSSTSYDSQVSYHGFCAVFFPLQNRIQLGNANSKESIKCTNMHVIFDTLVYYSSVLQRTPLNRATRHFVKLIFKCH